MIVVADTSVVLNLCLGRMVATRLGLRTIGLLGILLDARSRGLIDRVTPVVDELEQTAGFWISPSLRARVLEIAGE